MNETQRPARRFTAFHWGTYQVVPESSGFSLRPLATDPAPSPIGPSLVAGLQDESRIRRPHVRKGWLDALTSPGSSGAGRGSDTLVPVDWDTALDLVANELQRVGREHGNQAIFAGSYGWGSAGRFHHPQSQLHRFMNVIGGYTSSVNSYSFAAAEVIVPHVVGHKLRPLHALQTPWKLMAETVELFVCFGGILLKNAQVSPGVVGPHIVRQALERCAERGAKFINIAPVRDDLPELVDPTWLPIRPGTDVALILALGFSLLEAGLCDRSFLATHTVGFPEFERYLRGLGDGVAKTPEWAAAITDIPAAAIRDLAVQMAKHRTMISLSWSLQRGDHGEQPIWAGIALAAMLGQIGLPGGGFGIGYGGCNYIGNAARRVPWASLPQGRNPVANFIPVARIADMLLHPGAAFDYDGQTHTYPDIKLVYWAGGNPFHHHQDLNRLVEAWRRPQTVIVNEIWWNATARRADIILPATTPLERNDIAALSGEPLMVAMRQAMPPVGEARNDYDIFRALASRLGAEHAFSEGRSEIEWVQWLYEQSRQAAHGENIAMPTFETFWEEGLFELQDIELDLSAVLFSAFRRDSVLHPLPTPSGKIEIVSDAIAKFKYPDCPPHPAWIEPAERLGTPLSKVYPLHLISNQPASRLHSQYDHAPLSLSTKVHGREPIAIHPDDANERGIAHHDIVRVFNARGACLAAADLSDKVRRGVVQLATGAWFDPVDPHAAGSLDSHGNPNVLTLDKGTSRLAQAPSAMTALVQVESFDAPLPPVTIFRTPS